MAVKETERMVKSLNQYKVKVKQMIINNVVRSRCTAPLPGQKGESGQIYQRNNEQV